MLLAVLLAALPARTTTVANHSPIPICQVFIGTRDADDLGPNRLDEDETIASGQQRAFVVEPGTHDLMASDCDGATLIYAFAPVGEVAIGADGTVPMAVVNDSGQSVCEILDEDLESSRNLLPHLRDKENPTLVEYAPMEAGESHWLFLTPGPHHLTVKTCDDKELARAEEVAIPHAGAWTIGGAENAPATCALNTPAPRLLGLERVYFEAIDGPAARHPSVAQAIDPKTLRLLLPEMLREGVRYWQPYSPRRTDRVLRATDFRVPSPSPSIQELLLREVEDTSSGLPQQWWMLYADGCRVNGWYFTPAPQRSEGKLLTDLRIGAVTQPQAGQIAMAVHGEMQRPGGVHWSKSADLLFSASGDAIRLEAVRDERKKGRKLSFIERGGR
jgi:hypothetical protein